MDSGEPKDGDRRDAKARAAKRRRRGAPRRSGAAGRGGPRLRADLAAAGLGRGASRPVSRGVVVRPVVGRPSRRPHRRRRAVRGAPCWPRSPRSRACGGRRARRRFAASTATRTCRIGRPLLWPIGSPFPATIRRPTRFGSSTGAASPGRSLGSRPPPPRREWPCATRARCVSAPSSSRSAPRSSRGPNATGASRPRSTGAAVRLRRRPRASTPGSIRPPTPASRRSSSTSPLRAGAPEKIVAPEGSILVLRADASAIEARVEGALTPLAGDKAAPRGERADRTALDRSRRRRVHAAARGLAVRDVRHRRDRRRRADDHADRSAPPEFERRVDAPLRARRSLRRGERRGGIFEAGRRRRERRRRAR